MISQELFSGEKHNARAIKIALLMKSRDKDFAVVLEDGKFVGLIKEKDLLGQLYSCRLESLLNALNALHEAVCMIDREGVVALWTKGSEKLFGVEAEQIIGKKLESFFSNALLVRFWERVRS